MRFELAHRNGMFIVVPAGVASKFGKLLVYLPAENHTDHDEWGRWFSKFCSACGVQFTADNPCCCDAGLSPGWEGHRDGYCVGCCPQNELHTAYQTAYPG